MLLAIQQLSAFVARRSQRREQMLWIGGAAIVCGQLIIAGHDTNILAGESRSATAVFSQSMIATGHIWVVYGCLGWDRASLNVIPWRYPLIASCLVGSIGVVLTAGSSNMGIGAVLIAHGVGVFILSSIFARHAIAYRMGRILPFVGLYVLSTVIMLIYQYQHIDQHIAPDALAMTSVPNGFLFVIITWYLASNQRQQRLVFVYARQHCI
jgi:hypothetical protein